MKTDIILPVDLFENVIKVYTKEHGINPLYCVSICSSVYQCGLKYTGINLRTLQKSGFDIVNKK